jgi:hypothetical protein
MSTYQTIRDAMKRNIMAVNNVHTMQSMQFMTDKELLSNVHPLERWEFQKQLEQLNNPHKSKVAFDLEQ